MAVMIDYGHGKIVRTRGSFGVEDVRGFDEFMNDLLVSWPFEAEKKIFIKSIHEIDDITEKRPTACYTPY